ncbi:MULTISPECIES: hypothetical protein [unclassified Sinorhizobium]|uniref:hypothetical protein n=1 Tax=unclassified Sinorhizobium TaxID=2613772 RepID=UPI0024C44C81|nr:MULTISPECIES: hypothetical protein [unclassified Sinorhizobium]MDK1373585.1 hypothetical protein [Sinorhizobium sp. 6-70]MDK1480196.1 hypothetical protein [Sinorhizobium sp. 6-117]
MTSVSSVSDNTAALLILQQSRVADDKPPSAADPLLEAANKVSSEPSAAQTQAVAAVNSALLDLAEKQDSLVSIAMKFIDSEKFKSSDPNIKETLKKVIESNREAFAARIMDQQANQPGMPLEEAIANAITMTIRSNRDRFAEGEIFVGYKIFDSKILHNIADITGYSSSRYLEEDLEEAEDAYEQAVRGLAEAEGDQLQWATRDHEVASRYYEEAQDALMEWNSTWLKKFGWLD